MHDSAARLAGSVVVVGDVNIDVTLAVPSFPREGEDGIATSQRRTLGGSATNTAIVLRRLSIPAALVGRVGADSDGDWARRELAACGVDVASISRDDAEPTQLNVVVTSGTGERTMFAYRGANAHLTQEQIPSVEGASWLHVSGYCFFAEPQRTAALSLIADAHVHGVPVSVDVPTQPSDAVIADIAKVAPRVRTLLIDEHDAERLTQLTSHVTMTACGADRVVVKRGERGFTVHESNGVATHATVLPQRVVDTTGAGDAFAAGFIAADLWGCDVTGSVDIARILGAAATQSCGAGMSLAQAHTIRAILDAANVSPTARASLSAVLRADTTDSPRL